MIVRKTGKNKEKRLARWEVWLGKVSMWEKNGTFAERSAKRAREL